MTTAFSVNNVADALHGLLNVSGVTSLVSSRIYHRKAPSGAEPTYPLVTYQAWARMVPEWTLGASRSSFAGSFRVVGWTRDDPRTASDIGAAIEDALSAFASSTLVGGRRFIVVRPGEYINEHETRDDGYTYYQVGAIYEVEVTE